jgi:hypothetical protein
MQYLKPLDAAQGVYGIIDDKNVKKHFRESLLDNFNLSESSRFEATAGALVFKYKSGFGVIAKGKGIYRNDAILIFRGTEDLLRDLVLTDGNVGVAMSSTSKMVHKGFNDVFESVKQDLYRFFNKNNCINMHCIGHSLVEP